MGPVQSGVFPLPDDSRDGWLILPASSMAAQVRHDEYSPKHTTNFLQRFKEGKIRVRCDPWNHRRRDEHSELPSLSKYVCRK